MATIDSLPAASLWRRLAAALYDLFPLLALWFATATAAFILTRGTLDYHSLAYRLSLFGTTAAYFTLSWRYGGQTIGGRAWRVRVVHSDGGSIDLGRALARFFVAIVSLAALGFGFVWVLIDRDRRGWHDLATGTRVTQV